MDVPRSAGPSRTNLRDVRGWMADGPTGAMDDAGDLADRAWRGSMAADMSRAVRHRGLGYRKLPGGLSD
jgi:hypothetical protein